MEAMQAQEQDEQIKKAIELVSNESFGVKEWKVLPNWFTQNRFSFLVDNDVLYHSKIIAPSMDPFSRIILPKSMRLGLIHKAYLHPRFGRQSVSKTVSQLEKCVTWPRMMRETKIYVNSQKQRKQRNGQQT